MHIAARYGHTDAAKELIQQAKALVSQHEMDVESGEGPVESEMVVARKMLRIKNENNETALHMAARNEHGMVVVQAILSHEDPKFMYTANDYRETPLYLAAENGCQQIVNELLSNPNSKSLDYGSPNGRTTLHAAAMYHQGVDISLLRNFKA